MPRALPHLAVLAALALALTGCAPASKGVAPEPTAVAAPFASEEEALAAAVEAYARFLKVADSIGRDGGANADRLEQVASGEFLSMSVEGLSNWEADGWRQIGSSTFRDVVLQQFSAGPMAAVVVYLCHDVSDIQVLDTEGRSVVSSDRPDTNYMQVVFDLEADGVLRVSDRQRWDDRKC